MTSTIFILVVINVSVGILDYFSTIIGSVLNLFAQMY